MPPCQMHANFHIAPPEELISVTSPWPFAKWGLDLFRPFPQAPGQVKYLIVRVDYFTKWIEVEPNIKHQFISVEHPQANGKAEEADKVILAGLKKRLQDVKGAWVEKLPQVLWAYRTTSHSTTGETPF
ncbi:uncharacterized protein [Arachis hypogaea]|uniref:uncharacterized protein n=1 Tax=Arachis hypogaea TaxID=3818 RepID=UPI003B228D71